MTTVGNAVHIRASLSQVILHTWTETGDGPREQTDTVLCLESILFMWLQVVWIQGKNVAEVASFRGMEIMKFWMSSHSFDTLHSGSWFAMFQRNIQALSSSKTLSITYKKLWRHNQEHQNMKTSYALLAIPVKIALIFPLKITHTHTHTYLKCIFKFLKLKYMYVLY
jgi:hypothetical protein